MPSSIHFTADSFAVLCGFLEYEMDIVEKLRENWLLEAADEIERLRQIVSALAVPAGWQLVPVRPTAEMVEATFTTGAGEATRRVQRPHRANLYRKMLGAAPAQTHNAKFTGP